MSPPIRPGCLVGAVPPPRVLLPDEEDGDFGAVDCRGVLRGVCCLPVVLPLPRVAVGDSEPAPAVSREGAPEAVFPALAEGSDGEGVGEDCRLGCCCAGCCLGGVCGSGRPGR